MMLQSWIPILINIAVYVVTFAGGERHWEYVLPGYKIAVQGEAGSKAYLTPAKQM